MKYLFTYAYKGKNQGKPENGEGSMEMTVHGTDRITPKIIESAVEIVKQSLNACGIQVDKLAPTGLLRLRRENEDRADRCRWSQLPKSALNENISMAQNARRFC